jgi:hypothetical protein
MKFSLFNKNSVCLMFSFGVVSQTMAALVPAESLKKYAELCKLAPLPKMGQGIASVESDGYFGPQVNICSFLFDGAKSRTDQFPVTPEGKKSEFKLGWIAADQNISYKTKRATIDPKPNIQFYRILGKDFHPETPLRVPIDRVPIYDYLQRLSSNPSGKGKFQIEEDEDRVTISVQAIDGPIDCTESLVFIKKPYFLLESFSRHYVHLSRPQVNHEINIQISWKLSGSKYVFVDEITKVLTYPNMTQKPDISFLHFKIQEVNLNPTIQDSQFSLAGIGLPKDSSITDKVQNKSYKFNPN